MATETLFGIIGESPVHVRKTKYVKSFGKRPNAFTSLMRVPSGCSMLEHERSAGWRKLLRVLLRDGGTDVRPRVGRGNLWRAPSVGVRINHL